MARIELWASKFFLQNNTLKSYPLAMKNTLIASLLIFLLGNLCHLGLPWWGLAIIAALVGFGVRSHAWAMFFAAFLAGFSLWYAAAWVADHDNGGLLSAKVGQLFMGLSGSELMLVSGFLGALLAGLSALSGKFARNMFETKQSPRQRNYLQQRRRR